MPRFTFTIIWCALAIAQLLYAVVPVALQGRDPAFLATLAMALGVAAFGEAITIVVVLRVRALGPLADGRLDLSDPKGTAQLFTTLILCWILAESIAIYGFVLRILGAESDQWTPFAIIGGLLLLISRPWQRGLQAPARSGQRALRNDPIE